MEEDIKNDIRELEIEVTRCKYYGLDETAISIKVSALENILNELERLQKEIELENALENEKTVHTCLHCNENTPLYCETCYQELITKNGELQLENEKYRKYHLRSLKRWENKFNKQEENFDELLDDYIPKQVIRDKIEELKAKYNLGDDYWQYDYDVDMNTIDILKELLRE